MNWGIEIDSGEEESFENLLAQKQNWSIEYASKVCEEYRKFLFLCSKFNCCAPSQIVD
jgi:hypothetical protein